VAQAIEFFHQRLQRRRAIIEGVAGGGLLQAFQPVCRAISPDVGTRALAVVGQAHAALSGLLAKGGIQSGELLGCVVDPRRQHFAHQLVILERDVFPLL